MHQQVAVMHLEQEEPLLVVLVNAIQRNAGSVGKRNAWERPNENIAIIPAWNVEERIAKVKTVIIQVGLVSITILQMVVED